tara:strand:- start:145176 stop:145946 length:771 start_codon:yes stop_codon:yes gene_type:complete
MIKIIFLGTGTSQGIPVIGSNHPVCKSDNPKDRRLRVSLLVNINNFNYVIDCGPDFRQQMLTNKVEKIDGLFFTHEHADHTAGFDDIRPFFFRQGKIPIYAQERVLSSLKKRFDYIISNKNKYPGAPSVLINEILFNSSFIINNERVDSIKVMHDKLPVMGFRIRNFAYLTDAKTIEKDQLKKLNNLEVLVINALRIEPHHSHLNLEEAIEVVNKIKPKKTYLTHISHHMGFHDEVEKKLPKGIKLAYDNLKIELK